MQKFLCYEEKRKGEQDGKIEIWKNKALTRLKIFMDRSFDLVVVKLSDIIRN